MNSLDLPGLAGHSTGYEKLIETASKEQFLIFASLHLYCNDTKLFYLRKHIGAETGFCSCPLLSNVSVPEKDVQGNKMEL